MPGEPAGGRERGGPRRTAKDRPACTQPGYNLQKGGLTFPDFVLSQPISVGADGVDVVKTATR